jgi:hypothetical protein
MTIDPIMPVGTVFDTAVETDCIVVMSINEYSKKYGIRNAFLATSPYDNYKEPVQYITAMVKGHPDYRGIAKGNHV